MKIFDIAIKDLVRSFRSAFALGMMFAVPLLITGLIYFAFGGLSTGTGRFDLPVLKVAVVNQDRPAQNTLNLGKTIVDFMRDPSMPSWLQVSELPDVATARAALNRQEIGVAVLIPPDLSSAAMSKDGHATITILQDPTLTVGPAFVKDVIGLFLDGVSSGKIALAVIGAELATKGQSLDPAAQQAMVQDYAAWYTALQQNLHHGDDPVLTVQAPAPAAQDAAKGGNPMAALIGKIMAGMLIMFVFFTAANSAQSILREDEEGTLARLFTTPTSRTVILAGKFTSVLTTITVQTVVLLVAAALAFQIQWGEWPSILLATLGLVAAAAGFGVFLVSFFKNTRQGGTILGGVVTITGMMGGLFTTSIAMPPAFDTITLAMPQGWALRAWKLTLDGGGPGDVLLPALILLAIGAALFAIGASKFRKRFA